jgi:NADH-quinone oxidoreductase subunit I
VEACPTEAITESKLFEFSFSNRQDAIYTRDELLVDEETGMPQHLPWEDWREGEDLFTSAWMRATAPSGNAAYEGVVAWSGERGYGVRAPERGQSQGIATETVADQADDPGEQIAAAVDGAEGHHPDDGHGA